MEIQKYEYLENKKSFLHDIKNIFHGFLKGYHLVKKKIIKIADQSFEVSIHKVFHQQ